MVSKQHEPRRRKELAGEEWLGAWEAGILQVGNWQCPPAQREWIGNRGDGGGRVWESKLGRRARKGLHSCWPVGGTDTPPDPFSDFRPIHMQIPRGLGGCAQQLRTGKLLEDCYRQSLPVFFLSWAAWLKVRHNLDRSESTD